MRTGKRNSNCEKEVPPDDNHQNIYPASKAIGRTSVRGRVMAEDNSAHCSSGNRERCMALAQTQNQDASLQKGSNLHAVGQPLTRIRVQNSRTTIRRRALIERVLASNRQQVSMPPVRTIELERAAA